MLRYLFGAKFVNPMKQHSTVYRFIGTFEYRVGKVSALVSDASFNKYQYLKMRETFPLAVAENKYTAMRKSFQENNGYLW